MGKYVTRVSFAVTYSAWGCPSTNGARGFNSDDGPQPGPLVLAGTSAGAVSRMPNLDIALNQRTHFCLRPHPHRLGAEWAGLCNSLPMRHVAYRERLADVRQDLGLNQIAGRTSSDSCARRRKHRRGDPMWGRWRARRSHPGSSAIPRESNIRYGVDFFRHPSLGSSGRQRMMADDLGRSNLKNRNLWEMPDDGGRARM